MDSNPLILLTTSLLDWLTNHHYLAGVPFSILQSSLNWHSQSSYKMKTHLPVTIPALPGAYILQFIFPHPHQIEVGKLGWADFPAGTYHYAGSAIGPGGLKGRLGRHLRRKNSKKHWRHPDTP